MGHCYRTAKIFFIVSSLCCRQSEDSDVDAFQDTTSDSSSECGFQTKFNVKLQNHTLMKNEMESLSLMHKSCELQGDSSSDECELSDSQGQLLFEYFERRNPYTREPLADKVNIVLVFNDCIFILSSLCMSYCAFTDLIVLIWVFRFQISPAGALILDR